VAGPYEVGGVGGEVTDLDPHRTPVLQDDPGDQAAVVERELLVGASHVAHDDVGAGPDQRPVCPAVNGQRHRLYARRRQPSLVDRGGQPLAHEVGVRRAVEGGGGHAEQSLALPEKLVQVGEEVDPFATAGAGARSGPVGAHAADVARHRG